MTPEQFLTQLKRQGPAPVYLFIGPEAYHRNTCRKALLDVALGSEDREEGFIHHDLDSASLSSVLDDARSLSLFATRRLLWISGAEIALPRGRAAASGGD